MLPTVLTGFLFLKRVCAGAVAGGGAGGGCGSGCGCGAFVFVAVACAVGSADLAGSCGLFFFDL